MNEHRSIIKGYIDHLEYMKKNADEFFDREQADKDIEAFKAAIQALEQDPCEDAISRQDVLDLAKRGVLISNGNYESVCKAINELPPVNPQPKTGHWINTGDYYTGAYGSIDYVECSCCHEYSLEEGDYCPNCGAKMKEVEE